MTHVCTHEPPETTYHYTGGEYVALLPLTATEARNLAHWLPTGDTGADGLEAIAEHLDDLTAREASW